MDLVRRLPPNVLVPIRKHLETHIARKHSAPLLSTLPRPLRLSRRARLALALNFLVPLLVPWHLLSLTLLTLTIVSLDLYLAPLELILLAAPLVVLVLSILLLYASPLTRNRLPLEVAPLRRSPHSLPRLSILSASLVRNPLLLTYRVSRPKFIVGIHNLVILNLVVDIVFVFKTLIVVATTIVPPNRPYTSPPTSLPLRTPTSRYSRHPYR